MARCGDAQQPKLQSSYRMVYYQGTSLDALRHRAAKRGAPDDGGGSAPKAARGARETEADERAAPAKSDWLDCVPEVPEEEEEAAAAAAMEAKATALPAAGEQLEVEVAEAGGAVAWKAAEVRTP